MPMTENMPGGDANKLGDVLRIRNGKTVEVLNTDAEGRLILADALASPRRTRPDAIVDLATLTGACMVALGTGIAGLISNDDGLRRPGPGGCRGRGRAGLAAADVRRHATKLKSEVADIKNIGGGRWGGELSAGKFLQEFVGDGNPGPTSTSPAPPAFRWRTFTDSPKGGTGFGVRTLLRLLSDFRKPGRQAVTKANRRRTSARQGGPGSGRRVRPRR